MKLDFHQTSSVLDKTNESLSALVEVKEFNYDSMIFNNLGLLMA